MDRQATNRSQSLGYETEDVINCLKSLTIDDYFKTETLPDGKTLDYYTKNYQLDGRDDVDKLFIKIGMVVDGQVYVGSFKLSDR